MRILYSILENKDSYFASSSSFLMSIGTLTNYTLRKKYKKCGYNIPKKCN